MDKIIDLKRLGFTKLNIDICKTVEVNDLFTITGRILLFKKSKYYSRYFEWYTENVSFQEVQNIYHKCGIEFYDLSLEEMVEKREKVYVKR